MNRRSLGPDTAGQDEDEQRRNKLLERSFKFRNSRGARLPKTVRTEHFTSVSDGVRDLTGYGL